MQKFKIKLEELFPKHSVRVLENTIKMNTQELTDKDLDKLSYVEGMYKTLLIKRSGTGMVLIFKF